MSAALHTEFDPLSPAYLRNPTPTLKRLHTQSPVFHYAPLDCWVVTRYRDLVAALKDTATFSSRATGFIRPPPDLAPLVPDLSVEQVIITIDPPEHARHRNALARGFLAAIVARMEQVVQAHATALIDSFIHRQTVDIMADYAVPLTMNTIVEILGVPPGRKADYRQWSEDFFFLLTPRVLNAASTAERRVVPPAELHARWSRLAEANRFLAAYVDSRAERPGDDIISAMLTAREPDGSPSIDRSAVILHLISLIGAGHDTTANTIAHLVQNLSDAPDQQALLAANPALIPNAVEEGLRMRGSVPGNFRVTTAPVTFSGVTIPANALVYLLTAAGGHDEEIFPNSARFDIQRENANKHLAFGFGRHSCIGNALARLQARIAIAELTRRLPTLRVPPTFQRDYLPLMTVTGLQALQVDLRP
jgi:cytochrome P450